jgi:hypothetical protein
MDGDVIGIQVIVRPVNARLGGANDIGHTVLVSGWSKLKPPFRVRAESKDSRGS